MFGGPQEEEPSMAAIPKGVVDRERDVGGELADNMELAGY